MSKTKGNGLDPLDFVDGASLRELIEKRTTNLTQPQMAKKIESRPSKNSRMELRNTAAILFDSLFAHSRPPVGTCDSTLLVSRVTATFATSFGMSRNLRCPTLKISPREKLSERRRSLIRSTAGSQIEHPM